MHMHRPLSHTRVHHIENVLETRGRIADRTEATENANLKMYTNAMYFIFTLLQFKKEKNTCFMFLVFFSVQF